MAHEPAPLRERPASRHLTLRVPADLHARLERAARSSATGSRSGLAARLLDEGLRMDAHPGVVFRSGPGGRRPGLALGPDVWEIARVVRDVPETGESAIARTAELTGLALHQVRAAAVYYAEFTDEVDAWVAAVDRGAREASPHSAAE